MNTNHNWMLAVARFALVPAIFAGFACSSDSSTSRPASEVSTPPVEELSALTSAQRLKIDRAVAMAKAIEANPDAADEILKQHGMTEEGFEDLLFEIAGDPAMSQAYLDLLGA
ncbi:MAG: hypothetical protein SGJ11_07935 [Phycisphaerae bacterium]|nr:hypothetical protein [Phycisphaerae bacterium]